jgi:hypothetical protein
MGRIYEDRSGPVNLLWFWSLHGIVGQPPAMRTDGHASTLDEAEAQFEAVWRQWLQWWSCARFRRGLTAHASIPVSAKRSD